jgi:hypothetical protein
MMTTARRYIEQMFLDIFGDGMYDFMMAMTDDEVMAYIVEAGKLGRGLAHASLDYHTNTLRITLCAQRRNKAEQESK